MDHKVLSRQGYILKKKKLTKKEICKIKKDLEVTPKTNPDYAVDIESFKVYTENENFICVPRYYGVKNFGAPEKVIPMDTHKIKIKFKGSLRDKQKPIVDICIDRIKKDGGGIISLPCGKTLP